MLYIFNEKFIVTRKTYDCLPNFIAETCRCQVVVNVNFHTDISLVDGN